MKRLALAVIVICAAFRAGPVRAGLTSPPACERVLACDETGCDRDGLDIKAVLRDGFDLDAAGYGPGCSAAVVIGDQVYYTMFPGFAMIPGEPLELPPVWDACHALGPGWVCNVNPRIVGQPARFYFPDDAVPDELYLSAWPHDVPAVERPFRVWLPIVEMRPCQDWECGWEP